jgi:hypothetical protein
MLKEHALFGHVHQGAGGAQAETADPPDSDIGEAFGDYPLAEILEQGV